MSAVWSLFLCVCVANSSSNSESRQSVWTGPVTRDSDKNLLNTGRQCTMVWHPEIGFLEFFPMAESTLGVNPKNSYDRSVAFMDMEILAFENHKRCLFGLIIKIFQFWKFWNSDTTLLSQFCLNFQNITFLYRVLYAKFWVIGVLSFKTAIFGGVLGEKLLFPGLTSNWQGWHPFFHNLLEKLV